MSVDRAVAVAPRPPLLRVSVERYHRMIEAGILGDDDPVELLDGCLVMTMVRKPPHHLAVSLVTDELGRRLPATWFARVQSAVTTEDSEPEPDVAVVLGPRRRYATRHPSPVDVALIVEVADSSLERDRTDKARIYAEGGVSAYWIVNLVDGNVEVHGDPREGVYQTRAVHVRGESFSLTVGGAALEPIMVDDLLP